MNINLDKLIYLDAEYISRKYEELKGTCAHEQISKSEGARASIMALFMNAGVHTQETRTYTVSSREMLQETWNYLCSSYDEFIPDGFKNHTGTTIAWMKGILLLAEWTSNKPSEESYEFYSLAVGKTRVSFLSNKQYFSAGFKELFDASTALKMNTGVPVKCLVRIMWKVDKTGMYTGCPFVIIEDNAWGCKIFCVNGQLSIIDPTRRRHDRTQATSSRPDRRPPGGLQEA